MKFIFSFALLMTVGVTASPALALDTLVETVVEGCRTELETHCADVTAGEGRLLACLYAYDDKLSGKCQYALYDAADQLERFLSNINYVVNECFNDLASLCATVKEGEGRIARCLLDNNTKLSGRCAAAVNEVDLKLIE